MFLRKFLTKNLLVIFQPMRGIKLLVNGINKIQLFPAQLTSIHADLCQVSNDTSCTDNSHFFKLFNLKMIFGLKEIKSTVKLLYFIVKSTIQTMGQAQVINL